MPEALKARWCRDELTFGAWCLLPDALSAEMLAKGGFDWVLIDMQHGCMDYDTAAQMIRAIDLGGVTPMVRVPWNEPGIIGRMLDAGAMGVVVPMIQDAQDAQRAVDACLYPPAGRRSFGPIRVGVRDGQGYFPTANERVAVIPMIETADALANVEAIAAVPGVDALFVGPFDLSIALGLPPGDNDGEPLFDAALARIGQAAQAVGIATAVLANANLASLRARQGFRMISVVTDAMVLTRAAGADLIAAREAVGKRS